MRRRIKRRPAASRFMRTSCQDDIKSRQNEEPRTAEKKENEKREDIAEEVADVTNEVEINANFREKPGHKAPKVRGGSGRKGRGAKSRKGRRRRRIRDRIAVEGGERGAESRCRRDWKLEEPGRWLRGRLINFFAFFDPHKLCRYTTTEGFAAGVKGLGFFPGERDGKGCRRRFKGGKVRRGRICTR